LFRPGRRQDEVLRLCDRARWVSGIGRRAALVWKAATPGRLEHGSPPPTPKDEADSRSGAVIRSAASTIWSGLVQLHGLDRYGVYTLIGDTPVGPFRADAAAYRLCGNSTRWVALWARFCPTDSELLVNGYMYSGYTYETGETWLPPLKRAVVDAGGHLRLGYWKGNDTLQAAPLNVDLGQFRKIHPQEANADCSCKLLAANRLELQAQPERNSIVRRDLPTTIAVLDCPLDFPQGVVLTGTIQATCRIAGWSPRRSGSTLKKSRAKGPRSSCTATAGPRSAS